VDDAARHPSWRSMQFYLGRALRGPNGRTTRCMTSSESSPRRDAVASIHGLVLHRDVLQLRFAFGTAYLLTPVSGRTVGIALVAWDRCRSCRPHGRANTI